MEILDNQFAQDSGKDGLQVTRNMKINWLSTSKWVMFLAILGFIFTGLMVLMASVMMPMLNMILTMSGQSALARQLEAAGTLFMVFMLLMVAVMFFIHYFHLRFANGLQRSMQYDSQVAFESAWRNLRNFFRINGIITIAMLVIYAVVLIFIGSMAASQPDF